MRTITVLMAVLVMADVFVTSGCGSRPPTRFYSLDPAGPDKPLKIPAIAPIKVNAVHIPAVLDRLPMVRGEHDHQLSISSEDRWGADLGEMVRRVLTQDLEARLPEGMVISPNAVATANARGLVVDILNFAPSGADVITLDAQWDLLQGSPVQPAIQHTVHLAEPFTASASSQASAMSRLVGRLADDITTALQGQSAGQ